MKAIAKPSKQAGFTIIELMIATAVFSVIILVVTAAVLQFSRQYYKGIIASSTQGATRALVDDISRAIQFNGGGVFSTLGGNGYCVGSSKRYSYELNQQVTDTQPFSANQGYHGLVSDTDSSCSSNSATALNVAGLRADLATEGLTNPRELLGQNMRLTKFSIVGDESTDNLYTINARIVYGDNDLLCSPKADDCDQSTTSTSAVLDADPNVTCKSNVGSQFCAVSELTTTVRKRVTQ